MKKIWTIITISFLLATIASSVYAHKTLQGLTEVRYWDETNAYNGNIVWEYNESRAEGTNLSAGSWTMLKLQDVALIPAGEFLMGDHHDLGGGEHANDEVPTHTVHIDAFYMATTETSNQQYAEYLNAALAQGLIEVNAGAVYGAGSNDLYYETSTVVDYGEIAWDGSAFSVLNNRETHPVVGVRWFGAAAYTNWLSAQHGYTGCYDLATWECDFSQAGYRLPTEAEWEYAGRGGLYDPYRIFPWGDDDDITKANWPGSGDPFEIDDYPWTTPVGFYNGELHQKADFDWPGSQDTYQTADGSNDYGLYDMAGNVWEWSNDWYDRDYYSVSPYDNPTGPATGMPMPDGNSYHTLRGGNWYNGEWGHSRVSNRNPAYYRGPDDPNHAWYHIGFRVALDTQAEQPTLHINEFMAGGATSAVSQTVGLILNDAGAYEGYTLLAPKHYTTTYLIDNQGRVINTWESDYEPGQSAYLLENGHLLRTCFTRGALTGGGEGGRIEEYDWDGNMVWEFNYSTDDYMSHHDVEPLPNGNVLMLVVEKKSYAEVIAAGFDPSLLHPEVANKGYMLPDSVVEIEPSGANGGTVVWEWHVWDHLIQDFDSNQDNYGVPADQPELVDVNGWAESGQAVMPFWNHMNSIDYNADFDQLILSVRGSSELWVIDHSTTSAEAASHTGGNYGKGGDLLYRWGNPQTYDAGGAGDQMLFDQHDTQWIEDGYPGAGNILIFNNGLGRDYSSVDEIVPPVDASGNYSLTTGTAYGPNGLTWTYVADPPADLYSEAISGAGRLPNGNTLICDGVHGVLLEVTPAGETVWQYINPVVNTGPLAQGELPALDVRGHNYNAVFKVHRYPPDYAAFVGQDMTPGDLIERYSSSGGDWIELYNSGGQAADLGGYYLTDDLSNQTQFRVPDGVTVPAGGYLVFYADGDTGQGAMHTNFELDAGGEAIGLFASGTMAALLDSYTFGAQSTGVSEGRCPDGGDTWTFFDTATPGVSNGACNSGNDSSIYLPILLRH